MKLDPQMPSAEAVDLFSRLRRRAKCAECGYRPAIEALWSGPANTVPTPESEAERWAGLERTYVHHCGSRGVAQGWAKHRPA